MGLRLCTWQPAGGEITARQLRQGVVLTGHGSVCHLAKLYTVPGLTQRDLDHLFLIRLLIRAEGIRIAATDVNGETALHRACLMGNCLVVSKAFLGLRGYSSSGSPNRVACGSSYGEGPPSKCSSIVSAADLNRVAAPTGFTPLHVACQVCPAFRGVAHGGALCRGGTALEGYLEGYLGVDNQS